MRMLYDSEAYVVVHLQAEPQVGKAARDATDDSVQAVQNLIELVSVDGESKKAAQFARHGFEIVDKRSGKEVYLDGSWAELFQQQIDAWQEKTPTQEEVEDTLERYAQLAQNPVLLH
jgi:hypothetical protein